MRKLKLQMNMALGDKWDDEMTNLSLDNLVNVDNILLGRNTAEDFIPYCDDVAKNPKDDFYTLGKLLSDIPKVVFSNKLKTSKWENATLAGGKDFIDKGFFIMPGFAVGVCYDVS